MAFLLSLSDAARSIGAARLLFAAVNWDALFTSAAPPGAPAPSLAKATLTRDSRRRWDLARKARRANPAVFLAALRD